MSTSKPSLLDRLRGLAGHKRLLPFERELVRRTILALDPQPARGSTPDEILDHSERRSFKAGQVIVAEGAPEDSLYVLLDGRATVERDGRVLERFREGEVFGEISLLTGEPRMATVRAAEDCVVLHIKGERIDAAMRERLWDYAAERRFMSLREHPVADPEARHLWWRQARVRVLPEGEYEAGAPWVFLFAGQLEVDGQRLRAPALFNGGRLRIGPGEARIALLPELEGAS